MKKTIFLCLSLLMLSVLLAAPAYFSDKYLFSLTADQKPLTEQQMISLDTPYPALNKMIQKYHIIKIEPWLSNARPEDHDGEIYLNRIYRLITGEDQPAPFTFAGEIVKSSNAIQNAEPEAIMRTLSKPDDPRIGDQWYLYKAQAQEAWSLWDLEGGEVPGNRNIVVAVVDDGVEYTHPDLWKNIWINQDEISAYIALADANGDGYVTAEEAVNSVGDINGNGVANLKDVIASNSFFTNGADTDGDGYIDNIIGWDTDESGNSTDDDKDPMVTNNSHGTHVAGLVGATTDNNTGVASIAYNISIMPVKATGDETTNSINTGWDGILYAAHAGADIINCSWGGPGYSSYAQSIINNVYNNYGALVIAAAGNGDEENGGPSDEPHYPSGYDNVVSVTAVSSQDIFSWANYGAADPANNFYGVDLSAPGESMLSTYLTKENSYAYLNGTSMASPMVASCFALLKSVYPDSSNGWLIDRMLSNTDPIDDKNPDYAGQLGTGRINILKALVYDKWPKLSIASSDFNITGGDGDNVLNPGEGIDLFVELKNDIGWTAASNLRGVLRSNNPEIVVTDSTGSWPVIPQNASLKNTGDEFALEFDASLLPDNYDLELELIANDSEGYPYKKILNLSIALKLDQEGFPFNAVTEVETSPLFVDMDDNGTKEIIFGDKSGNIYAIDHQGDTLPGFPISIGSQTGGIAVADIDLDDTLEIVATGFDKLISVYDIYGHHEWDRHADFYITAMPAIGNLDDDPELEIVVGSYDQKIYVLNHDSSDVSGFPYASGQLMHSGVSLADLNADGKDDIVYVGKSGQCGVITSDAEILNGWPVSTSGSVTSEPQVIVTGDSLAIILWGNDIGDMFAYDLDGTQRFMVDGNGSIKASPAIYGEGDNIFAFFGTTEGNIYKLDIGNNQLVEGWPKTTGRINQSLALADIAGGENDEPEVLAMGNDGYIYALDLQGNAVQGFPLNTNFLSKSALAVADIDADGDVDIISGNYSGISVIDIKDRIGNIHWPMHRGAADRKGSVSSTWTRVKDLPLPADNEFELIGNAPNPFNPSTVIRYRVGNTDPVELNIFTLNGKRVVTREIAVPQTGMNEIRVDLSSYASGIYFYTLEHGEQIASEKMIFLK